MEDTNDQAKNQIKEAISKWLPGDACEELIKYICGEANYRIPYFEVTSLVEMMRELLEDATSKRAYPLHGYDIYRLEAIKRIYVTLYNLIHSRMLIKCSEQLNPESENILRDAFDMAAEELLKHYMIADGYILFEHKDGMYFDHLKLRPLVVEGSGDGAA